MSKLHNIVSLIRRAPKRTSAIAVMIAAAIVIPAITLAYGPDRQTFTWEKPANYVTFNSITDNPVVGDERNFVRIKEDGTNNTYGKTVSLVAGKTYDVEVYYHNNAASNLNLTATNAMLRMEIPGTVNAGGTANINGYISADNATPGTVYDTATATNASAGAVSIAYVANSATFTSNGAINGQTLPTSLFTTGAKLGYNAQDGNVPGCNQYAGYVTFKFTVNQPNFTVQKQVSVDGGKTWSTNASAQPGDTIQYRVIYTDTGTTQQDNVTLSDQLPKGVSYVAGSSLLANSVTGGQYKAAPDGITTSGVNIGSYAANGGNAYFKFSAKIADDSTLACGANTLVNTARASTSSGYKESTATVTVNKTCTPPQSCACSALNAVEVGTNKYSFTGSGNASNGATITGYTLDFGDGSTPYTGTSVSNVTHTYPATGQTYTARLSVTVKINGQSTTVTSQNCEKSVTTVKPPQPTYACTSLNAVVVSGSEYKFTGSASAANGATITGYTLDFGDGSTVYIGTSVSNVTHTYPTTGQTYTARLTANVSVNGQSTTVTSDSCTQQIKTTKPATYACTALNAVQVTGSEYKFDGSATASNGATITGYSLDFGDSSSAYTGSSVSGVTHTYPATGQTYTARLTATVMVNGQSSTITSDACAQQIKTTKPVTPVFACTALQGAVVSGNEYQFNGSATASNGATITGYSLDFGDSSTVYTGTSVANVTHTYPTTGGTYTARLTANVSVNGQSTTVTSDACTVPVTITPPTTPPTTPPELPHTGPTETFLGIVGLGAIVASLGYFISSRRALGKVL